ncbi:ADP-ribose pyrophosphatase [Agromyces flavus]|uniref:ADP-ribose pyrophosphatase n=1 Tax=Agromyces flavus TaxID=589382 RepID=A0A1H1SRV7_9MICO|nr:NUDIX hydrolase [Agromyces flavus]MCP2369317.1 ADP-ribose pyrophosphatase [Agromyces flavus]GGI48530.1 NUDIX hydrolase [Agromyces flavus]SDS50714.1 ADP-ribose pyrophosphatase [Agromyces flavus]
MPDVRDPVDEYVELPVAERETVFEGRIWDVRRDTLGYGDEGASIVREYVDHPGAVAVVALDDDDRVLLIKQYRHPVRARDWEIPAGLLDVAHESPLDAAKRELAEEADLVASDWAVLADYFTTPGGSSEAIRIYLARGLADAPEVHARVDEEADMEVRWVPLDECVDAVLERRVGNPSLTIGVLAAQVARGRGWSGLAAADVAWPAHPSQRPAAG